MSKPSITNCPNTFFRKVHSFNCIFSSLSCFACVQIRHTPLSGGYCGEVPPLPIPNREVKLTCADGTALQCGRVGSRLLLSKPQISKDFWGFFVFTRIVFWVTQISQMTQILFWCFFFFPQISQMYTDFRPVRSGMMQIFFSAFPFSQNQNKKLDQP